MTRARELAELGSVYDNGALSNRNIIINGAMQVAQRGTSFTTVTNNAYTLDRFNYRKSNDGEVTITQDSSGPDGFSNSLKVDVTTADTSIAASQLSILEYNVEAQDLQRLAFGTSGAKNFTLSFYVKSNKTGTYAVNISQNDNSGKQATLNYTINSADTWERKTLTFNGDTSGVINDDNGIGFTIYWWLAVGSTYTGGSTSASFQTFANADHAAGHAVNILDNTSNEWLITGVQLEVGDTATDFEHRSFGQELQLCQRYFAKSYLYGVAPGTSTYTGMAYTTLRENNQGSGYIEKYDFQFPVRMRSNATITIYDHTGNSGKVSYYVGSSNVANNTITVNSNSDKQWGGYSDRTTTIGGWNAHWTADAEL